MPLDETFKFLGNRCPVFWRNFVYQSSSPVTFLDSILWPRVMTRNSRCETEEKSNGSYRQDSLRTLDEVDRIQGMVCDLMESIGFGSRDVFCVRLAIDESLNNAIKHGNQLDPSKNVRVAFRVNEDHVWVQIEDEGEGFEPAEVPDPRAPEYVERPGGRGVHIIQEFMCSAEYNERGNCLTMRKHRSNV